MNKHIKSLGMGLLLGGALNGSAIAADTSVTIVGRKAVTPVGAAPVVSVVEATATSNAASAHAFTFDIAGCPKGIRHWQGQVRDVSGSLKLAGMNVSGHTVTVSDSIATSGTIVTGDVAKVIAVCKQ